jgi:hypothetical protein
MLHRPTAGRGRRSHPMSTIALFSLGLIPLGGVVGGP